MIGAGGGAIVVPCCECVSFSASMGPIGPTNNGVGVFLHLVALELEEASSSTCSTVLDEEGAASVVDVVVGSVPV